MADAEFGRDLVEIGHGADVDPGLRHCDDDRGLAEAERRQQLDLSSRVGKALADQILAGDAEMGAAAGELVGDLGSREVAHLYIGHADELAAIVARASALRELQSRPGEERGGVLLQAAFRGHGEDEGALGRALRSLGSRNGLSHGTILPT